MIHDSGPTFDWPDSHYTRETASSVMWPVSWSIAAPCTGIVCSEGPTHRPRPILSTDASDLTALPECNELYCKRIA